MEILNEIFNGDELLTHMEQEFRHDQNFWMAWFEVSNIGKEVVFTWIGRTSHLYLVSGFLLNVRNYGFVCSIF
jgi:hypothetical protein